MIEYTVIGNFKFKGQEYQALIDDNRRYYFLKINEDGSEGYIDIHEYIQLINEFKYKEEPLLIEDDKEKKKKKKMTPKIIIAGLIISLSLSFVGIMNSMAPTMDLHRNTDYSNTSSYTIQLEDEDYTQAQKAIDELYRYIEQENNNFEVDTRVDGWNLIKIYDNSELDDVLGYTKEEVTYDDIINDINNNPNISPKFKELYITLANNLREQYPTLDLRIWHINLQTLKIEELSEMDMQLKAMSGTACAVYRQDENTIYTVEGYDYVQGTWDYQVIMHEMGHPIRSLITHIGDNQVKVRFQSYSGYGTVTGEALNSLFTLRSYDPNERDVAYQLQSNMVELMVSEMDNYSYQDYVEHNLTYFEQQLNEYNGNNDAVEMIGLMELQYKDYHNKDYEIDEAEFHKLYDYIANMYYGNHLNPNMSTEEALQVRDDFIDRLTFDVPEEYNISVEHLNQYFQDYCNSIGLSIDGYTR